jgi:hypothetical protein
MDEFKQRGQGGVIWTTYPGMLVFTRPWLCDYIHWNPSSTAWTQTNLYAMYKVPIEAAVALGLQAWKQLLVAVKSLSEDKKAGSGEKKGDAVKPHAA